MNPARTDVLRAQRSTSETFVQKLKDLGVPEDLRAATSWAELQDSLQRRGLALQRAGRGLQITDGEQVAKISALHRRSSLKNLEDRFLETWNEWSRAAPEATRSPDVRPRPGQRSKPHTSLHQQRRTVLERTAAELKAEAARENLRTSLARQISQMRVDPATRKRLEISKRAALEGAYKKPRKAAELLAHDKTKSYSPEDLGDLRGWSLMGRPNPERAKAIEEAKKAIRTSADLEDYDRAAAKKTTLERRLAAIPEAAQTAGGTIRVKPPGYDARARKKRLYENLIRTAYQDPEKARRLLLADPSQDKASRPEELGTLRGNDSSPERETAREAAQLLIENVDSAKRSLGGHREPEGMSEHREVSASLARALDSLELSHEDMRKLQLYEASRGIPESQLRELEPKLQVAIDDLSKVAGQSWKAIHAALHIVDAATAGEFGIDRLRHIASGRAAIDYSIAKVVPHNAMLALKASRSALGAGLPNWIVAYSLAKLLPLQALKAIRAAQSIPQLHRALAQSPRHTHQQGRSR